MHTFDPLVKLTFNYNPFPVGQLMFELFCLVLRSTLTRFDYGILTFHDINLPSKMPKAIIKKILVSSLWITNIR